jgi:hypothetical protein
MGGVDFIDIAGVVYAGEASIPAQQRVRSWEFVGGIVAMLNKKRYDEALTVCEESPGMVALILTWVLIVREKGPNELPNATNGIALQDSPLLDRRLPAIQLIANNAALIRFADCGKNAQRHGQCLGIFFVEDDHIFDAAVDGFDIL